MTVETFCLGNLETNAYLVSADSGSDCWLFDCPGEPHELLRRLAERSMRLQGVFLTHAHVDHIAGLNDLRRAFPGVKIHQHRLEASWLSDPQANLSVWLGEPVTVPMADEFVEDGQNLTLGPWSVEVLHVPGHSPGSVAYWFASENELISGDVLFRSGVGRWDFPHCDRSALRRSLGRLCQLPDQTRVRPGHGGSTTIGREKTSNPYLRSDDPWV